MGPKKRGSRTDSFAERENSTRSKEIRPRCLPTSAIAPEASSDMSQPREPLEHRVHGPTPHRLREEFDTDHIDIDVDVDVEVDVGRFRCDAPSSHDTLRTTGEERGEPPCLIQLGVVSKGCRRQPPARAKSHFEEREGRCALRIGSPIGEFARSVAFFSCS